jgi:protein kinase X
MDLKSQRFRTNLKDWSMIKKIGEGLFGKVKLAKNKKNEAYCAIKILQKSQIIDMQQVDHIYSEYSLLKEIEHPFIVILF